MYDLFRDGFDSIDLISMRAYFIQYSIYYSAAVQYLTYDTCIITGILTQQANEEYSRSTNYIIVHTSSSLRGSSLRALLSAVSYMVKQSSH